MKHPLFIFILFFAAYGCNPTSITTPEVLNDGWLVSTPQAEGFNEDKLIEAVKKYADNNDGLNSLLIARNGKLVVEEYYNGYDRESKQKIWSITKPVTNTLIGIAADKGYLTVEDPLTKYFNIDSTSPKAKIEIYHLLAMSSGLEWEEMGGPGSQGFDMAYSNNWVNFVLQQPMIHQPGEVYNYSTGNTVLLAPILKNATDKPVEVFADEVLFTPLGITDYEWDKHSDFWETTAGDELPGAKKPSSPIHYQEDYINTGSGLRMRARDIAKIAQLHLNQGVWNKQQVVSSDWVTASTRMNGFEKDYGLNWDVDPATMHYFKTGFGGQIIFVAPELELVVVITQSNYRNMGEAHTLTNKLIKGVINSINP